MVEDAAADNTRSRRKAALKEDVKHLLEELWDVEEDETFYKIFTRETKKGMHKFINFYRDDLKDLSYREDNGSVYHIQLHEIGDVRVQFHCLSHLKARDLFPEDKESFRFNSISRRDWSNFVVDADAMSLLNSTGYITAQPPPNTGLSDHFKITYSPADSFKKSIKRDANMFTTFKDGKH